MSINAAKRFIPAPTRRTLRLIELNGRNLLDRILAPWRSDRANYPRVVAVNSHNVETVNLIRDTKSQMVAEIGIYEGHTSLEIAKVLNGSGELHLFDYQDRVDDVGRKIERAGFKNIRTFGSSYKLLDSYNWQLAKLIEANDLPIYDYVFLDGAHTFAIDALTFFLADRLLKTGGYFDFDDYYWKLGSSPSLSPEKFPLTAKLYTGEQIDVCQVEMIVRLLVRKSGRYREVVENKAFQKTS
jgi:Methyltransferase domain